jgi:hypothetical protein
LPGLHGSARLFDRSIAAAPPHLSLMPMTLPAAEPLSYDALADRLSPMLPAGRVVLLAESFSGPLAVALAKRRTIAGLLFCNSHRQLDQLKAGLADFICRDPRS